MEHTDIEYFPVASWLLPQELREPIHIFYQFARGADDIVDMPRIASERRRQDLLKLDEALATQNDKALPAFARPFAILAREHPPLLAYGRDLLSAFVQDTIKARYQNYNELLDYCQRSAAPVGRAVLYICSEEQADKAAADALCNALQILNHVRDCADDYVNRDRVYLPLDWFEFAGAEVKMLAADQSAHALRQVIDRALDNCDTLIAKAKPLYAGIRSKKVRKEIRWIGFLAEAMSKQLRKHDPLQKKISISKPAMILCLAKALLWR